MMRPLILPLCLLALVACKDETLSGYAPENTTWIWQELDGQPAPGQATLRLPKQGMIRGQAPCNSYSAQQTAPYPWFRIEGIAATKMACPGLGAEAAYFKALGEMTLAEVSGDILLLSNDAGREMVFVAVP